MAPQNVFFLQINAFEYSDFLESQQSSPLHLKDEISATIYSHDHYDEMNSNIDLRTELLLKVIHEKSEYLHQEVEFHRIETEFEFEALDGQLEPYIKDLQVAFEKITERRE